MLLKDFMKLHLGVGLDSQEPINVKVVVSCVSRKLSGTDLTLPLLNNLRTKVSFHLINVLR